MVKPWYINDIQGENRLCHLFLKICIFLCFSISNMYIYHSRVTIIEFFI